MILYHRTNPQAAQSILREGFRDNTGEYMTTNLYTGVWLSNVPLDENEGAFGDILLEVTLEITESEIGQYECIEQGKPYREFLVPAAQINARMKIRVVED